MNILAEEQLRIFETGLTDEERILREEKFNNLYFQLRKKDETGFSEECHIKAESEFTG